MNDEQFNLHIGAFEGPLDLLLSLIQERKLYINEISLAKVTNEYITYVSRLSSLPIAETSHFVLIAATLLLIKSRSLLPHLELSNEEEESIEELERRLAQYRFIKESACLLQKHWDVQPLFRGAQRRQEIRVFAPAEVSVQEIVEAGEQLMAILPENEFRDTAEVETVVSLEDIIKRLENRVVNAARTTFKELTSDTPRAEVIVHFLALLELLRSGTIQAAQTKAFDTIKIEKDAQEIPQYGT